MTISFPLALPSHKNYRSLSIRQHKVVAVSTSPFSLVPQTYEWPGERWEATMTFAPMARADGEAWVAWLTSLRGPVGSCMLNDLSGASPRGSAAQSPGTPLLNGLHNPDTRTISIDGAPNSATGYLKAGDWLQLGTGSAARLYKVLQDVNTNGSGQATIELWPMLRVQYADNSAITLTSAKSRFMLAGGIEWDIDSAGIIRIDTVRFIEDLRA